MSAEILESAECLYNVIVSLRSRKELDTLESRLIERAGLSADKAHKLTVTLHSHEEIIIGSRVPQSRVAAIQASFERAGLMVTLKPVLSVQGIKKVDDGKMLCPACDMRVILTSDRQCPECHVFIDKLTPEFILRKKLEREESERLKRKAAITGERDQQEARRRLEDILREEIRRELEAEMGLAEKEKGALPAWLSKKPAVAALITVVLALTFGAGYMLSQNVAAYKTDLATAKLGDNRPPPPAASAAPTLNQPPELLPEDALLMDGQPSGSGGITLAQAVNASEVLAKSIGYSVPGEPGRAGSGQSVQYATLENMPLAASPTLEKKDGRPGHHAAALQQQPLVQQMSMAQEVVGTVSRMGQNERAERITAQYAADPRLQREPTAQQALAFMQLETRIWRLARNTHGRNAAEQEQVLQQVRAQPAGLEQARAWLMLAEILSSTQPAFFEVDRAYLGLAEKQLENIASPARKKEIMQRIAVVRAQALGARIDFLMRAGQWQEAQRLANELLAMPVQENHTAANTWPSWRSRARLPCC